jgi:hypothetical protein
MSERVALQPVDAADVTIVVDNAIDILAPSTEVAQRPPLVWDWSEREQLRAEHGLVVLSSCSHAGVINVLHHAQRLTGVDKVHAVVGGLHLTGGLFEAIIPRTMMSWPPLGPMWWCRAIAQAGRPPTCSAPDSRIRVSRAM